MLEADKKILVTKNVASIFCLLQPFLQFQYPYRQRGKWEVNEVENDFAKLYRGLIERLEPEPARLRRGWQAIVAGMSGTSSTDPPQAEDPSLHFPNKYDNLGPEPGHPSIETQESREEP